VAAAALLAWLWLGVARQATLLARAAAAAVLAVVLVYTAAQFTGTWLLLRVPQALLGPLVLLEELALPLGVAAAALLAWLWLGVARQGTLLARVAAAAVLGVVVVYTAAHMTGWSVQPAPLLERVTVRLLATALLGVAALQWLPVPGVWRRPLRRRAAAGLLLALPLLPLVLLGQRAVAMRLVEHRCEQRLAAIALPLPPGVADMRDGLRGGVRIIRFTAPETYPSTAVADFYARRLGDRGWRAGGPGAPATVPRRWDESAGYYVGRRRHAGAHYQAAWTSPDGEVSCLLRLSYLAPESADPHLPLEQWSEEWLGVQRVRIILALRNPFG
jgi:hypothetical protein